ncbi:hypothetical protein SRABI06_00058 [Pseudomonas brassicacearum]|nr:hypothetical protein SRABI06_00058 [Pseudomonas brassicacearum]
MSLNALVLERQKKYAGGQVSLICKKYTVVEGDSIKS